MGKSLKVKRILTALACIIAVGVLSYGGYWGYEKYYSKAAKPTQNYMRVRAKKDTIEVAVSASGTVTSSVTKDFYIPTAGTLEALPFKEGDKVNKGDVIAKIKTNNAEDDLIKAENTLQQQQLTLSKLQKDLENLYIKAPVSGTIRVVNITKGDDLAVVGKAMQSAVVIALDGGVDIPVSVGSGTVEEVNVSKGMKVSKGDVLFKLSEKDDKTQIEAQQLSIQETENEINNKKETLQKATIISTIDGMIATQSFNLGDTVESGKLLATILDPSQMQTVVTVDELDIAKVKVGQKAKVSLDALPDKTFDGEVLKIANVGKTSNGVTTYDVTISIQNPENIKPGMTTNVKIQIDSKKDVVVIPLEAIQGKGKNTFVLTQANGRNSGTEAGAAVDQKKQTAQQEGQGKKKNGQKQQNGNSQNADIQNGTRRGSSLAIEGQAVPKKVQIGLMSETYAEVVSGVSDGEEVLIPIANNNTSTQSNSTNPFGGSTRMPGGGGYSGRSNGKGN